MSVSQVLGALGGWEVQLRDDAPDYLLDQLGFFSHVAIADGFVDVAAVGDGLLTGARYVGVLRAKDKATGRKLSGSGMVFWLGDEDGKGDILETQVSLTNATLATAVNAILGPSTAVDVGTVYSVAGTYTGKHQFQSRREALSIICDAFNVEFRVNGNGTVDVGTAAQLYNTEAPDTIVVRKGAGTDMDLVALGGDYTVDESVYDYSTRVVLLGQTAGTGDTPETVFATGSADAPVVNYLNLFGSPVKQVRTISESGTTSGSVAARAQLQLNRFNRVARSLKVSATEFETEGNFVVGDNVYVYDPDTGIVNPANEVSFRGEVLHPDVVRVSGITWPVVQGMTVAFRTQAGAWLDLTPFVTWETGGNELTVGDLPTSLTKPGDNPVQVRLDAARGDDSIPNAPTGLTLNTSSALNAQGETVAIIRVSWTEPALNTDNSVITDLSHYVVRYRPQFRAPNWFQAGVTAATEIDLTATPSLTYDVQVAAVDLAGHMSAFTAVGTITASIDTLPPNAPADPVVTSYLGQLRIEYPGTDSSGNPMAPDTNRIDVHVGTTSTFTATVATRVDSVTPFAKGVSYATAPYSATDNRWVRLIAVDHTGNPSASSAAVGGHTVQAGDGDIAALSVGKLTAGIMTADVTVSGRFATALTGARREMNAVGFQGWDASNNLTISLDGVNNLLTGRFRTALAGRRIEMGASGYEGVIRFIAADGRLGTLSGFTGIVSGSAETIEGIRLQMPVIDTHSAWNSLGIDDREAMFGVAQEIEFMFGGDVNASRAFTITHIDDKTTAVGSLTQQPLFAVTRNAVANYFRSEFTVSAIDAGGGTDVRLRVNNADIRFEYAPGLQSLRFLESTTSGDSPRIQFVTAGNVGGILKMYYLAGAAGGLRFEFRSAGDTGFERVWAAGFDVQSDEASKRDIRDAPASLPKLRKARPKVWKWRASTAARQSQGMAASVVDERDHLGLIAQQVPAEMQVAGSDGLGINLYAGLAMAIGAVGELADVVDELSARIATFDSKQGGKP